MSLKPFFLPVLVVLIYSCNSASQKKSEKNSGDPVMENVDEPIGDTPPETKKETDRDYSVTPENSYNDVFLDSLAMDRYIARRELADKKISRRIRSFYN